MKLLSVITVDWPRKTLSLICAFLIWYAVHSQISQEEIFRDLPVTLEHPKNLSVPQDDLPKLSVTLRGSKKRLMALTNSDIKIIGSISKEATSGRYTVLIRNKNIKLPRRFQIIDIQPNSFYVHVDTIETVDNIPIRCRFLGKPSEGYGRKGFSVVPKTAQLTGPSKTVGGIKEILTEIIELDNDTDEDFEIEVQTIEIPNVTLDPKTVNVVVELYKMKDSKFFPNLKVLALNTADTDFYVEAFITPPMPKIESVLRGPTATIDFLTESSVRPFIDISDITTSGKYLLPVHVWVDANECSASNVKPMIMEVQISRKSALTHPKNQ